MIHTEMSQTPLDILLCSRNHPNIMRLSFSLTAMKMVVAAATCHIITVIFILTEAIPLIIIIITNVIIIIIMMITIQIIAKTMIQGGTTVRKKATIREEGRSRDRINRGTMANILKTEKDLNRRSYLKKAHLKREAKN